MGVGALFTWVVLVIAAPAEARLIESFRSSSTRVASVTIEEEADRALLDPQHLYPDLRGPRAELRALRAFEKHCQAGEPENAYWPKAWRFASARCSKKLLDLEFFEAPPSVHPLGGSYLGRALEMRLLHPDFDLQRHVHLLHALELPRFVVRAGWRQGLSAEAVSALARGEPIALDAALVFLRSSGDGPLSYDLYSRAAWDAWERRQPLRLVWRSEGAGCLSSLGSHCWVRPTEELERDLDGLRRTLLVVLGGFVAFGLLVGAWSALARVREARERAFVFQMLAHELRTPMTSLALEVDAMRQAYESLPDESRDRVLKISVQVERLRRLVAGSDRYLGALREQRRDDVPEVSVNLFLEAVTEREGRGTQVVPLANDRRLPGDPFWLEVALKSLIDNALQHGAPPVVLSATIQDAELVLEVKDQGSGPRRRPAPGRGFGLRLVERVARRVKARVT